MRLLLRAALMALSACLSGAIAWSLLASTIGRLFPPFGPPQSLRDFIVFIPVTFLGSLYFALFIAVAAFPLYIPVFFAWLRSVQHNPRWLLAPRRLAGTVVGMAFPPALVLLYGFGESTGQPFDWRDGGWAFAFALSSGVLGVLAAVAIFRRRLSKVGAPAA